MTMTIPCIPCALVVFGVLVTGIVILNLANRGGK